MPDDTELTPARALAEAEVRRRDRYPKLDDAVGARGG